MKFFTITIFIVIYNYSRGQLIDTSTYHFQVEYSDETNKYFAKDLFWRGADGASSIDLENGNVLWLFSDSFICLDSSGSRKNSTIIRNSIAIQQGYDLNTATIKYYWNNSQNKPEAFFHEPGKFWYWTGHGVMLKDKLIVFLLKEQSTNKGIGFEATGWCAVLISNPHDDPTKWNMQYIDGVETFGTIVGSAAILKNENYIYAYGAVEPETHEVYLLRWKIEEVYKGNLVGSEWLINGKWELRNTKTPVPQPLFIGETEFSVHYDPTIKKFIQIQSFGFGEGEIGLRLSDSLDGKWTEPYMFYKPEYPNVKRPFMYAAKAHPELRGDGIYITYNVNSFDFVELTENNSIYFPKFIRVEILEK